MSNYKDVTVTVDGVVADWFDDEPRSFKRGRELTYTLSFVDYLDETLPDPDARFDALADYLEYETDGLLYRGTTDEGEPWFREDVPEFHPVDSYLVNVEFGPDVEHERHGWALVIGGEDVTPSSVAPVRQLELDLFVLAERGEYADESAVRDAFSEEAF